MAPTIVYDRAGRVAMLAGSPGGSAIANYVAKTLIGVIDWQLDPQAAVSLGNFGSRNGPTELEAGTPVAGLAAKLRAMGYDVRVGHADQRIAGDRAHARRMDRRNRSAARRRRAGALT